MPKIMLSEQRTLDGFTYEPDVEYEVDERTAAAMAANFPRVYGEPKHVPSTSTALSVNSVEGEETQPEPEEAVEEQSSPPDVVGMVEEVAEAGPPPVPAPPPLKKTARITRKTSSRKKVKK